MKKFGLSLLIFALFSTSAFSATVNNEVRQRLLGNCILGMFLHVLAEKEDKLSVPERMHLAVNLIDGLSNFFPRDLQEVRIDSPALDALKAMVVRDMPAYEKFFQERVSDFLIDMGVTSHPSENYHIMISRLRRVQRQLSFCDLRAILEPQRIIDEVYRLGGEGTLLYTGESYTKNELGHTELKGEFFEVLHHLRLIDVIVKERLGLTSN